jgi:hypothetical protein
MRKRQMSIFFFLASYLLLFFALWFYADFNFAPYHNRYYFPLDLHVHWDTWDLGGWLSYFFKTIGSYLFAGLHLFYAIRQIIRSHRQWDYLSLGLNNLIFSLLLVPPLLLSYALHYLAVALFVYLMSRYPLSRNYGLAMLPFIGYVFCVKFWWFTQGEILGAAEKAKRKAKNDFEG